MSEPTAMSTRLIGEIFVQRGLITHDQLEQALDIQRESGAMLGEVLVNTFGVSRIELAGVLAEQWTQLEQAPAPPAPSDIPGVESGHGVEAPAGTETPAPVPIGFAAPQEAPTGPVASEAASSEAGAAESTPRRPIGEIFVERGMITSEQLEHALELQRENGERLGEILVRLGVLERLDLAGALSEQWAGLQKLRPPSPTPPQPWQEMAVRQGPVLPSDAAGVDVTDLREAVSALEQQISAIALRPDPDLTGVRAETRAIEQRLASLESNLGSVPEFGPALAELQSSFEQLANWVEQTVGGDHDGVRAELDRLAESNAGAARAADVDALRSSFVAAESAVTVGFDELRRGMADVASRVEALGATPANAGVTSDHITRPELEAALSQVSERISGLVESALQSQASAAAIDLSPIETRLAELEARTHSFEAASFGGAAVEDPRVGQLEHELVSLREHVREVAVGGGGGELVALREQLAGVETALAGLAAQTTVHTDVATRSELAAFAGDVRSRLDELAASAAAAGTSSAPDPRLDGLHGRLEEVVQRLDGGMHDPRVDHLVSVFEELRSTVAELALRGPGTPDPDQVARDLSLNARTDQLTERIESIGYAVDAGVAGLRAEIDQRLAAFSATQSAAPLEDLTPRLNWIEQQLAALAPAGEPASVPVVVEERLAALASRDELAALASRDELAALASRDELSSAVADLAARVHAVQSLAAENSGAQNLAAGLDAVAIEMRQGLAHLTARLDELSAGAGHVYSRLTSLEHGAASGGNPEFAATLAELRARIDQEAVLNAERARVSERAIRKGLANLGERIVGTEQSYLEAGAALRRSVERLGAAVIEADVRLAGEPVDPPTVGHVAFVPTKDGYRLQALPDSAPTVGELVEIEGAGQMRVVRVTISPLPLDRRPCVYLEPAQ